MPAKYAVTSGLEDPASFRWQDAYQKHGEAGLKNAKSVPKNPANQTPPEIVGKVLYLRRKYHLGPIRIVWYLAHYHGIKISDAGVYESSSVTVSADYPEAHQWEPINASLRGTITGLMP